MTAPVISLRELQDFQSRLGMPRGDAVRFYHWIRSLQQAGTLHGATLHRKVVHADSRLSSVALVGMSRNAEGETWWGCVACDHRKALLDNARTPLPNGYRIWQPPSRDVPRKLTAYRPVFSLCPACIIRVPIAGLYGANETPVTADERLDADREAPIAEVSAPSFVS